MQTSPGLSRIQHTSEVIHGVDTSSRGGAGEPVGFGHRGACQAILGLERRSVVLGIDARLSRCARVEGLVFVFPEACIDEERERVAGLMRNASLGIPWKVVAGGALRQDSVRNGLSALPDDCMEVLIHDAARPFVSPVLVNRILDGLHGEASGECVAACIPGIPVVDTIKVMDEEKKVVATPDRKHLMAVQTPQGFSLAFLRAAHQRAEPGRLGCH